jgi:hypothetical protein
MAAASLAPAFANEIERVRHQTGSADRAVSLVREQKALEKEIELMLKNGFKLEVEALISKDISYVTEEYVPARLKESEFLDQRIFIAPEL